MWATGFALALTPLASPYFVANNIPNMIFELVAGGILSALFIPTYLELKAERGEDAAWAFASHVFNLAVLALGVIAVIGTLWPEPFIWTQTFRSTGVEAAAVRASAEFLFRFFAIQVVIYGGGMVIQGVLNANRRYVWTALGPVFNNLVVIGAMFAYAAIVPSNPDLALIVLAAGTTLGVLTMFAVMLPDLLKSGLSYRAELGLRDPAVRHMLLLAVPTVIYVATNLVAVSFKNASALAASPKGPAALMYAWTFYQLPYGILAVALATAVFTELAEAAGRRDIPALKAHFTKGLRATGLLMLPCAALLIALAVPLVSLYRVGEFNASDVQVVAEALQLWAVGLLFFACMMLVLRTFYSMKDTRTPMLVNLALAPFHIGFYVLLTTGFAGWDGLGINGIPVADDIFYLLMLVWLGWLLRRRIGTYDATGVIRTFGKMALASLAGGAAAWWVAAAIAPALPAFGPALAQVILGGSIGLVVTLAAAWALRIPEISSLWALVARLTRRSGGA
jgi:putative peptidoglycan lipid II flippase